MAKVKLNDVAIEARETWKQNKTDVPVVGLEHLEPDEIWLKRWDLNPDENTFTKGFRKGQLLFGRRRAYQKKMSVASCDGICSGDITVIAAKPEKILPDLLPFYLRTDAFFDFAVRGSGGSLSPRVKWSHISDYEFDLPPMEEQKKLAELLWAANDLKEKYKKAITVTDEMLKAKFREMFGEKSEFPYVSLGELFEIGSSKRVFEKDWQKEGVPFYRAREIVKLADEGFVNNELFISEEMYEEYIRKYGNVKEGDILVTGVGTLGVCYLVRDGDRFYYKDGNCICLHTLGKVDSKYVVWCFKMPMIRNQIAESEARRTTVGTYTIEAAKRTRIKLPPLFLQREFVAIAEKAEAAKTALKKSIADIDQVMKGLING